MPKKMLTITYLLITLLLLSNTPCLSLDRAVVSVVFSSDLEAYHQAWEGVNEFFRKNNIALSVSAYNLANDDPETVISGIKKRSPQIIFALGTKALKLLKPSTQDVPILVAMVMDQSELKGPNVTGVTLSIPTGIKLEWLRKNLPQAKRIGLVYSQETSPLFTEISQKCNEFGYTLIARKINSGEEIARALQEISRVDCFLMIPDTKIYFPKSIEYLFMEGLKRKFAIIGLSLFYTRSGAFVSFDCDYKDLGRQTAEMAIKVLQGQSILDIPPEPPDKATFSLNLLVAEKIGVKLTRSTIEEAKEVLGR